MEPISATLFFKGLASKKTAVKSVAFGIWIAFFLLAGFTVWKAFFAETNTTNQTADQIVNMYREKKTFIGLEVGWFKFGLDIPGKEKVIKQEEVQK